MKNAVLLLVVMYLMFASLFSNASSGQCEQADVEYLYSSSLLVVLAENTGRRMSEAEFAKYLERTPEGYQEKNFKILWREYVRSHTISNFEVKKYFKGKLEGKEIAVFDSPFRNSTFRVGGRYVLFLNKPDHRKDYYLSEECFYLDYDSNEVIVDSYIRSKVLFVPTLVRLKQLAE